MKAQYMIALCDILGFSKLIESNPLDTVMDHALGWFRKALHHSIYKNGFPDKVPQARDLESHKDIGVALFSDTILLYTLRDDDEAIRQLIITLGWLIFETILGGTTKIRGGVSYGEAFIDRENAVFVGSPIVEAYRLEQSQQWAGAALTQAARERIPEYARSGKYADWWITPYNVPLKDNITFETLAINWTYGIHRPEWKMQWSKASEFPTDKDQEEQPDICDKFLNTKIFHDTFCWQCKSKAPFGRDA
jgi:hypothetical protein